MNAFITRFGDLLLEEGRQQKEICKDLGISPQKLSKWKTGYSEPNFDDLAMLAEYFDVSTDYLLGITDDDESPRLPTPAPAALPLDESELLKAYRKLSYTGKARVVAYADLLHEQEQGAPPVPATVPARKKA